MIYIVFILLFILWAPSTEAAPAHVQSCLVGTSGTSTTQTCTFGSSVTQDNLVVCGTIYGHATNTVTFSDTASNTYSQASVGYVTYGTTPYRMSVNYAVATTGGFTAVTATYSSTNPNRGISCDEYSGVATSSPADGSNGQVDSVNFSGTADSVTTGSISTTVDGDLIWTIGWDGSNGCIGLTAGTGFTIRNNTACRAFTADQVQSSAGSITPSWTPVCCTNTPFMVIGAAFSPPVVATSRRFMLLGVGP